MTTIETATGCRITVGPKGLALWDRSAHLIGYELSTPLTADERRALVAALNPGQGGQWTRDDLPAAGRIMHESWKRERYGVEIALSAVVDHLNAYYPKPQPYDQGGVRGVDSLLYRAERERDEWKARAEQAERERDIAETYRRTVEQQAANVGMPLHVSRADVEKAVWTRQGTWKDVVWGRIVEEVTDAVMPLVSGADPAVHVVRESDLPAARVDGDYYVVASAKGDYKWPQHGPSWWAGRAQDALAKAARYTSLALLAAREAVVDTVEAKARELYRVATPDARWETVADEYRRIARHVLGQEATR